MSLMRGRIVIGSLGSIASGWVCLGLTVGWYSSAIADGSASRSRVVINTLLHFKLKLYIVIVNHGKIVIYNKTTKHRKGKGLQSYSKIVNPTN